MISKGKVVVVRDVVPISSSDVSMCCSNSTSGEKVVS